MRMANLLAFKLITTMTKNATIALIAAKNKKKWGRYATLRYVIKRKCPLSLYRLASQLEALSKYNG